MKSNRSKRSPGSPGSHDFRAGDLDEIGDLPGTTFDDGHPGEREELHRLRLLASIAIASNQAASEGPLLQTAMEEICAFTGWPAGHAFFLDSSGGHSPLRLWHAPDPVRLAHLFEDPDPSSDSRASRDEPDREEIARRLGLEGRFAISIGDRAILEFFFAASCERRDLPESLVAKLSSSIAEALLRISELRNLQERLERYVLAAHGANDGFWDWDLTTNRVYFSEKWKALLGNSDDEIGEDPEEWFGRIHPTQIDQIRSEISAHLEGRTPELSAEHLLRHKNGTYRWFLVRGAASPTAGGHGRHFAGPLTDITARKLAEEQLQFNAFHDALTGLPNRSLFRDRLTQSLRRKRRRGKYFFALLLLDVDRFKVVNDNFGHLVGDQLLVALAKRLERCLRPEDTAARFGGDEFTVLLDELKDLGEAIRVADRIQAELALPFEIDGQEIFTSASIGIATSSSTHDRPEDLLRHADMAMYRAKALGRGHSEIYDAAMQAEARLSLDTETQLRHALERNDLLVLYQPIVGLESGRLAGFEALVRWQHPTRGLITPEHFMVLAEETGLIVPIDQWVLGEACRQTKIWNDRFRSAQPLCISVNVSGRQFSRPELIGHVVRALEESGLDGKFLKLEITESVVMNDVEYASALLHQLSALEIRLSIDDFGTGYSSLSYLHRFPIHTLKIDRSFVSRMEADEKNVEIVRTIAALARNLGLEVIAEGVETELQRARLIELECGFGQGHLFDRALGAGAAAEILESGKSW